MDILRKELNEFYASQRLDEEELNFDLLNYYKQQIEAVVKIDKDCRVITDAASDYCYIFGGKIANHIGLTNAEFFNHEQNSSDEDVIYNRIHPEDLVDKRMLEYEFFKFINNKPDSEKLNYKAVCRIRIKELNGNYIYIDNSTRILHLSPKGKVWLILCCYNYSPNQKADFGISPRIINLSDGKVTDLNLNDKRKKILTQREREILQLIKKGKLSKQIAGILGISINTVNRHRQNVLEKLSVGNSVEAVMAATRMNLL